MKPKARFYALTQNERIAPKDLKYIELIEWPTLTLFMSLNFGHHPLSLYGRERPMRSALRYKKRQFFMSV